MSSVRTQLIISDDIIRDVRALAERLDADPNDLAESMLRHGVEAQEARDRLAERAARADPDKAIAIFDRLRDIDEPVPEWDRLPEDR